MAVKGVFSSHQGIVGARKTDIAGALLMTQPTGSAPMLALSAGMMSVDHTESIATWFEENHLSGRITVTNNAGTNTTMTVSDATQVVVGQYYLVESSGEMIYIDAIAGSSATVTRGFGRTTVVSIDGSSTPVAIQRIGTAFEEGSAKPASFANLGYPRFTYMQIFRNAWDITGTAQAISYHTGNQLAKNKADAALFHAEDIERASIFGVLDVGVMNGKPFRSMAGIKSQITTNVSAQAPGGNTRWADDFRPFFENIFSTNIKGQPNERVGFCGNTVLGVVEDMARKDSTINLMPGQTDFGMEINKIRTPFGSVTLLTHPLMNESPLWTKDMLIFHPAAIEYRWLRRTFDDNNDKNGTRAGTDADFGVITSELCVLLKGERTSGYYSGIDTAAASS